MPHQIRRFASILTGVTAFLICGSEPMRADLPSPTPAVEEPSSPDAKISRLIAALGDEKWVAREKAASELEFFGEGAYEALQAAYVRSDRYEVRDRIKRVAYEIHMTARFGPVRAFLGVSHAQFDAVNLNDARLPPGWNAVYFTDVIPGAAASNAGIRPGDLLLGLNGTRGSSVQPATDFIKWIGQQSPGTLCHLTVFQGGEGRILNHQTMSKGFDPRGFKRVKTRLVAWTEDSRLPEGAVGLELTDVARADARLDLKVGDMIVALDGFLLSGESAQARLEEWSKNLPAEEDEEEAAAAAQGGMRIQGLNIQVGLVGQNSAQMATPSIQLVRGGAVRDIELTLEARPPYLRFGRAFQRNMHERLREYGEAELGFENTWNEKFRRAGLTSDRLDAEDIWRLETK